MLYQLPTRRIRGYENSLLGKLGDLLYPGLIWVDFLNVGVIFSIKGYEIQLWHSIFVSTFGRPHSKPPLNSSFNSPF